MKKIIFSLFMIASVLWLSTDSVEAATRVKGYTNKYGTYVVPYYKSKSNSIKWDNYSTKGNYNPYTGKKGYKSIYKW